MNRFQATLLAGTAALLLLPTLPVSAQGMLGSGRTTSRSQPEAPREQPPALPGVAARRGQAPIPAEAPAASMNPNDALFDGINRGDIATVRDAVARGADVNARNALGLTAVDSAVDQGRPEIMFYVLSVRGMAGNAPPPPQSIPQRGQPARVRTPPAATPREAPTQVATATPRLPQLWQANGGAPQPSIGFLGFDAGTPPGASRAEAAARRGR
ncbi:ankyrin repeat domain-containing protein [Sediminicoccus sp. KRV36]|uniref:ankyrin repeat domain-containing protein n=1 Tax=Sediminicoccus sp. KRV36 TaxID=3133721 RepID=UPI00200DCEFE|nr:ankyrin repeat domain-containing protein [Sediminicoccus rosea]UPY37704.1 ankyrin repeat domain-containing protein [Sediminicoccus rosea]